MKMVAWSCGTSSRTQRASSGWEPAALRFDPAVGPDSLTRFNSSNSPLVDERTFDVERAPDGTMWFANNSCVRYSPSTDTWTHWDFGNVRLAAQPKVGGGYF